MSKPETIKIDDQEYVRKDLLPTPGNDEYGMPYVIVRSRNQGVMSGFLKGQEGQVVTLTNARQLWSWRSRFALPDMAEHGVTKVAECKFSCEMSQDMVMTEACGVMFCTTIAMKSIRAVEPQRND